MGEKEKAKLRLLDALREMSTPTDDVELLKKRSQTLLDGRGTFTEDAATKEDHDNYFRYLNACHGVARSIGETHGFRKIMLTDKLDNEVIAHHAKGNEKGVREALEKAKKTQDTANTLRSIEDSSESEREALREQAQTLVTIKKELDGGNPNLPVWHKQAMESVALRIAETHGLEYDLYSIDDETLNKVVSHHAEGRYEEAKRAIEEGPVKRDKLMDKIKKFRKSSFPLAAGENKKGIGYLEEVVEDYEGKRFKGKGYTALVEENGVEREVPVDELALEEYTHKLLGRMRQGKLPFESTALVQLDEDGSPKRIIREIRTKDGAIKFADPEKMEHFILDAGDAVRKQARSKGESIEHAIPIVNKEMRDWYGNNFVGAKQDAGIYSHDVDAGIATGAFKGVVEVSGRRHLAGRGMQSPTIFSGIKCSAHESIHAKYQQDLKEADEITKQNKEQGQDINAFHEALASIPESTFTTQEYNGYHIGDEYVNEHTEQWLVEKIRGLHHVANKAVVKNMLGEYLQTVREEGYIDPKEFISGKLTEITAKNSLGPGAFATSKKNVREELKNAEQLGGIMENNPMTALRLHSLMNIMGKESTQELVDVLVRRKNSVEQKTPEEIKNMERDISDTIGSTQHSALMLLREYASGAKEAGHTVKDRREHFQTEISNLIMPLMREREKGEPTTSLEYHCWKNFKEMRNHGRTKLK
ncbi:hypothetical protein ACFLQ2_01120 [archaeon]